MSRLERLGDLYRKVKAYLIMLRHRLSKSKQLDWITPNLAIGGEIRDLELLRSKGISALINLQAEHNDDETRLRECGMEYLRLPIKDGHAPNINQIQKMVDWVNLQSSQGRKIYMHCAAGVGRAPTMAIAFLISMGFTAEEARIQVKMKHVDTDLGPRQVAATIEYESILNRKEPPTAEKVRSAQSS